VWQDHPELGRIVVPHSPLRFDGVAQRELAPSRGLGADTDRVLRERLGLSAAEVEAVVMRKP
jgi:formyl-CoA transferase